MSVCHGVFDVHGPTDPMGFLPVLQMASPTMTDGSMCVCVGLCVCVCGNCAKSAAYSSIKQNSKLEKFYVVMRSVKKRSNYDTDQKNETIAGHHNQHCTRNEERNKF